MMMNDEDYIEMIAALKRIENTRIMTEEEIDKFIATIAAFGARQVIKVKHLPKNVIYIGAGEYNADFFLKPQNIPNNPTKG